jgi:hypothetical protein
MRALKPWRLSRMLSFTRTVGEIGLRKNGTQLDIWVRVNGKPTWFSVRQSEIVEFLAPGDGPFSGHGTETVLRAESDCNAEDEESSVHVSFPYFDGDTFEISSGAIEISLRPPRDFMAWKVCIEQAFGVEQIANLFACLDSARKIAVLWPARNVGSDNENH